MIKHIVFILTVLLSLSGFAQQTEIRSQKDTVGFASHARQMDSLMERSVRAYGKYYDRIYKTQKVQQDGMLRFAVCPHDDYTYAGFLYNEVFRHIKAKTVIIFGVAHKAKKYGVEKKIVFDGYKRWHAAYGDINTSPLRQQIIASLPAGDYIIHDSLQSEEHSVEALIPFLQYYNRDAEIISILVPHMPFSDMQAISQDLASAIAGIMKTNKLKWGNDIALVVSTDAVHYGDEDWGGSDYAPFGCDSMGYKNALEKEYLIMKGCFTVIDPTSAGKFMNYTVKDDDWHQYKWTWCGRYAVPFAMLTAYELQQLSGASELRQAISDYSTSIAHHALKVDDLNMGATAPANMHHWVGYCVEVYY